MQKTWFTMLASALLILIGSSRSEAAPSVKKMSIIGCWNRIYNKPFDRSPPTQNTVCFDRQNTLQGWTVDDGDGWDYGGTWRYAGTDSISIDFPDADEPRRSACSFWVDEARGVLVLTRCEISGWNGAWQRDLKMERAVNL